MKFPFVRRSRLESESKKWRSRVAELKGRLERAKDRANQSKARASELEGRVEELNARLSDLDSARQKEGSWLREVEGLCEIRAKEIEILKRELQEAEEVNSQLLAQLVAELPAPREIDSGARGSGERIPIMFGFDFEPDGREVDRENPTWDGGEALLEQAEDFRDRLAKASGQETVPLSWFLRADPQVELAHGSASWAFDQFSAQWHSLISQGDELGIHMHPWRWDEEADRWRQDHADEEWLLHCLDVAIDAYCDFMGRGPTSYRGGDRFFNAVVMRHLEKRGIKADFSLERMKGGERLVNFELGAGAIPDHSQISSAAFWPSENDYRKAGPPRESGFGLLPLTSYPGGTLCPWMKPEDFANALRFVLANSPGLTHLAFIARTDLPLSGRWEWVCQNCEFLAGLVAGGQFEFVAATPAWERIQRWLSESGVSLR